jgi:hypothetical protein
MFPRAAVSPYPVNKFGTGGLFAVSLANVLIAFDEFFPQTGKPGRKNAKTKKAGMKAGLPQFAVVSAQ